MATVAPVVTSSTAALAISGVSLTINGHGFDPVAAHNTVTFNDGATGTVSAATATSLTVTLGTKPTAVGSLTAVVTTNSASSGGGVQVAAVVPVVTVNINNLAINANTVTIAGSGFSTTAGNNVVTFNDGATGTTTAATATSLTVTFGTKPTGLGSLTAVVTTSGSSSGSAVHVATVAPVVTATTGSLAANATTLTINGLGFDAVPANNLVTFNNAAGVVTGATATSLTVTFSVAPAAGSPTAIVTTDGEHATARRCKWPRSLRS